MCYQRGTDAYHTAEKLQNHYQIEQVRSIKLMVNTSTLLVRELFVATVLAFESTFQKESRSA